MSILNMRIKEKIKIQINKESITKARWDKQVVRALKDLGFKNAREILRIMEFKHNL